MHRLLAIPILAVCLSGAAVETPEPNWPDAHALACMLTQPNDSASNPDTGIALKRRKGEEVILTSPGGVAYPAASNPRAVVFSAGGLRPDSAYVLGFEWWDADGQGRRQSVAFKAKGAGAWMEVLPSTVPAAFHADKSTAARVLLPVPADMSKAGSLSVRFKNEGGPDAVVGQIWLLERTEPAKEKRVLIVTGDDFKGHRWRETGPELAEILREDPRLEVSITETPAIFGSPLLKHYDAVVLHFKNYADRLPLGEAVRNGLQRYLKDGNGLVVAHFGCGAFQEWNEFEQCIGRVWNPKFRAHDRYGPFEVRIVDGNHPITRGLKNFKTEDELYTCLDGTTPIRALCDAVSNKDGKVYPMGLVLEGGPGRVFNCTLGHDVNAFQSAGTRTLYRRAVAWAAGVAD